jgi:N-acetylneuraminate lyase
MRINGNMAAAFTPIAHNGVDVACHYDKLHPMAQRYQEWGIKNVMIGGTTGESVSLTFDERYECVNEWLKISDQYKLDIYVHVGMNSVQEAKELAHKVSEIEGGNGAKVKGILAMPPTYFRPSNPDDLVSAMAVVASGAPDLPFWYYHFPAMTYVDQDMFSFVRSADESGKIPNLMGVKYTDEHIM